MRMMIRRPYGTYASPWREMRRMRREMDRLLNSARQDVDTAPCYPAMNVWTNEDGAIATAELPGFDVDQIDIAVEGETLTVSGNREPEQVGEGARYHRRERGCGRFTRSFQLPFQVEGDAVEATFERGVLRVELPRAEADKPRRIEVKAG
jgi:HSP20 family protein